jgi:ATP-dependent RNA helicase HelY
VLGEAELPAGDFVRWTKQVIDLLGQVADAARVPADDQQSAAPTAGLAQVARTAADSLRRGVVAWSTLT